MEDFENIVSNIDQMASNWDDCLKDKLLQTGYIVDISNLTKQYIEARNEIVNELNSIKGEITGI